MLRQVDKLAVLQELDIRIMKLQQELKDIPAKKKEIEESNSQQREAVQSAEEMRKSTQAKTLERELAVETEQQQITKLREQQLLLKTNKEFKAMDDEIRVVLERISKIEDEQLALLEEGEEITGNIGTAKGELEKAKKQADVELLDMDNRQKEVEEELEGLSHERENTVVDIDTKWLARYEQIFNNKKDAALVSVEHGVCGGCNLKLPPHVVHDVKKGDEMIFCSYCGRLLC